MVDASVVRAGLRDLVAGYRLIWRERLVRAVVLGSAAFMFAPSTVYTLAVVFVEGTLHGGTTGYGIVVAGMGAGSLVGVAWAIRCGARANQPRVFAISGIVVGLGIIGLALSPSVPVAAVLYGLSGCGSMLNGVAAVTIIQRRIPNTYQGRVFAANASLDHTAVIVSTILIAALSTSLGVPLLIGLAGAIPCVLGLGLLAARFT